MSPYFKVTGPKGKPITVIGAEMFLGFKKKARILYFRITDFGDDSYPACLFLAMEVRHRAKKEIQEKTPNFILTEQTPRNIRSFWRPFCLQNVF